MKRVGSTLNLECWDTIRTPEFIISVVALESVLAITLPLSKSLQCPTVDLIQALDNVKSILDLLTSKREEAEQSFSEVYDQASSLANEAGVEFVIPRQAARQTQRANTPASSPQ
jgi:hypothetical protein